MTRWKASAIHFAISFAAIGAIAALVVWRWYPPELFGMAKAGTLLALLGGVDLVLGPLLTLIVYKQGKKSLKFDLTVIALLQAAALSFGLHTVWQSRPVYVVAVADRFRLVFANEIDAPSAARAPAVYRTLPAWGPRTVSATLPQDPKARLEAMLSGFSGLEIFQRPDRFSPYPPRDPAFLGHSVPARTVLELAPEASRAEWERLLQRHAEVGSLAIMPLQSSRGSATVLMRASDGGVLGYSRLDPWPIVNALERRSREPASP
jgi:hypothetical protein